MSIKHQVKLNVWITIPSPELFEIMLQESEFDTVTIDIQHGLIDISDVRKMLTISQLSDKPVYVRIPSHDKTIIGKMLDYGACGIICPDVNTAEEAKQVVSAMLYPPDGNRSFGPLRAKVKPEEANMVFMIESLIGVRNLTDILSVKGLSSILVGPIDLWISLYGNTNIQWDDKAFIETLQEIANQSLEKNIPCGIVIVSESPIDISKKMISMGYTLITPIIDSIFIKSSIKNLATKIKT